MKTKIHPLLSSFLLLAVSIFAVSCNVIDPSHDEYQPIEATGFVKLTLYDSTGFAFESHYLQAGEIRVRDVPPSVRFWRPANPATNRPGQYMTWPGFKIETFNEEEDSAE